MKIKFYSKIILVLLLTFFIADFLSKNVFLGFSPRLRPNLIAHLSDRIRYNTDRLLSHLSSLNIFSKTNNNQKLTQSKQINEKNEKEIYDYLIKNLQPVAKGIEASTYKNYSYTKVNLSEVEWVDMEIINLDGKREIIKVPKR